MYECTVPFYGYSDIHLQTELIEPPMDNERNLGPDHYHLCWRYTASLSTGQNFVTMPTMPLP